MNLEKGGIFYMGNIYDGAFRTILNDCYSDY